MPVQAKVVPEVGDEGRVLYGLLIIGDCNEYKCGYKKPKTRPTKNPYYPA
jgi:hypothetical protein